MKDGSAPAGPDYSQLIPLQSAADLQKFNTQLQASRVNTTGPTGSTTWSRTPQFDNTGYQTALASYLQSHPDFTPPSDFAPINAAPAQGAPRPGTDPISGRKRPLDVGDASGVGSGDPSGTGDAAGIGTGDSSSTASDGVAGIGVGGPSDPGGGGGGANVSGVGGIISALTGPSNNLPPTRAGYTNDQWTQTTTLSPEQQQLYNQTTRAQTGAAQNAADVTGQPFDLTNPTSGGADARIGGYEQKIGGLDPLQYYQKAADALYGQNTRYLDPQYQADQTALESRLGEQGFVPGTPAFQQAMDQFRQGKERAYADARDRSVAGGVSAGSTAFGNSLQGLQSQIAAALSGGGLTRQTGLDANAVTTAKRNQPINEFASLTGRSGVNVPNAPLSSPTPTLSGVDQLAAANSDYNNKLGVYNAGVQSDNANTGAIASLIAAYL